MNEYWIYILFSKKIDQFYTGSTENLISRFNEHNSGRGKYTSKGIPWILIYYEKFETRQLAVKQEILIKKRGAKRFLEDKGIKTG